jgi:hypothetical protein
MLKIYKIGLSMRKNVVLIMLFFGLVAATATVSASEPFGKLAPYWRTPMPYHLQNPRTIPPKTTPAPRTADESRAKLVGPYAYPYGYFGAQTRPYSYKSSGYYKDIPQTTYGWGY